MNEVATQTVTPQEAKQLECQRLQTARRKSVKKNLDNIKAPIRGKLQELQYQEHLVKVQDDQL